MTTASSAPNKSRRSAYREQQADTQIINFRSAGERGESGATPLPRKYYIPSRFRTPRSRCVTFWRTLTPPRVAAQAAKRRLQLASPTWADRPAETRFRARRPMKRAMGLPWRRWTWHQTGKRERAGIERVDGVGLGSAPPYVRCVCRGPYVTNLPCCFALATHHPNRLWAPAPTHADTKASLHFAKRCRFVINYIFRVLLFVAFTYFSYYYYTLVLLLLFMHQSHARVSAVYRTTINLLASEGGEGRSASTEQSKLRTTPRRKERKRARERGIEIGRVLLLLEQERKSRRRGKHMSLPISCSAPRI